MNAVDSRASTVILIVSLVALLGLLLTWAAFTFLPALEGGKEAFHSFAMVGRWFGYAIGFGCFVAAAIMSFQALRASNGEATSPWYGTLIGIGLTIGIVSTIIWLG